MPGMMLGAEDTEAPQTELILAFVNLKSQCVWGGDNGIICILRNVSWRKQTRGSVSGTDNYMIV